MGRRFFRPDEATRKDFRCLSFAAAPLGVLLIAIAVFEIGGFGLAVLPEQLGNAVSGAGAKDISLELSELRARMVWLTSIVVYYVIAVAVGVASMHTIRLHVTRQCFSYFVGVMVLLAVATLAYFAYGSFDANGASAIFQLSYGLLERSGYFSGTELAIILVLVGVVNFLATVAPFAIILGGCSSMAPFRELLPDEVLHLLEARLRHLKNAVNLGSAMLLVGVLHMLAWLRWPVVFVGDSKLAAEVVEWSLTLSMYWGTVFSLMVMALYIPCSLHLYERAKGEFNRSFPRSDHPALWKHLESFGFSREPVRQLPQIVAMSAPFLGGSLGASLSHLGGIGG